MSTSSDLRLRLNRRRELARDEEEESPKKQSRTSAEPGGGRGGAFGGYPGLVAAEAGGGSGGRFGGYPGLVAEEAGGGSGGRFGGYLGLVAEEAEGGSGDRFGGYPGLVAEEAEGGSGDRFGGYPGLVAEAGGGSGRRFGGYPGLVAAEAGGGSGGRFGGYPGLVAAEVGGGSGGRFGGYPGLVAEVERLMARTRHFAVYSRIGVSPPRGLLVHGPRGSGKCLLVVSVASRLGLALETVSPLDLMGRSAAASIANAFDSAEIKHPSVVLIDGLEALPERSDVQKMIAAIMDRLVPGVLVVATTDSLDCVSPLLRASGRFERDIRIDLPGPEDRKAILEVLTREMKLDDGLSLQDLAMLTPGFLGGDLKALVSESGIVAVDKILEAIGDEVSTPNRQLSDDCLDDLRIRREDFEVALKRVNPSAKNKVLAIVPDVSWEDVGALDNVRRQLETSIILPVTHPEEFAAMGIERPAGILICGPPGCGKTLLAKAIANELRVNFLSVKGPELLNKYVGESERGVRQCFQRAKSCRPCVIFMDEVDSLCPRRYSANSGSSVTARVVNQLLTELDGVEERRGVYVLAATNRPDVLDPALLRPGRLDKVLWVDLPSAAGRAEVLRALTRRVPTRDLDLAALAADPRLEGFSGADLSALVKEAALLAVTSHLDHGTGLYLTMELLHQVAAKLRPSVTQKELAFYRTLKSESRF